MNFAMIATALPAVMSDFATTQAAWIQTSCMLVAAIASPTLGKLADMIGKRRVLLTCVVIAGVGTFICAVAPNFTMLVVGRAMTGFLVPCLFLGYSLIRDVFPAKIVPISVAIATSGMGLISIPMPFMTGFLIDGYGWRSIFWFLLVALCVIGLCIVFTTDETSYRLRSRIDPVGGFLLGGGIGFILTAVSFGAQWEWASVRTLSFGAIGLLLLILWVISARVIEEPLIDLRILARRDVGFTALASAGSYSSSALQATLLPLMCMTPAVLGLGYGFGVSAEGYALFQSPLGAAIVVGGILVGLAVGRGIEPRRTAIAGTSLMAISMVGITTVMGNQGLVVVMAIGIGLGSGLSFGSIPNLQIKAVPPQLQATTASLVATSQNLVTSILPIIGFTVLNAHIGLTIDGAVFYSAEGMRLAWLVAAMAAALGTVAALFIPRKITQLRISQDFDGRPEISHGADTSVGT